MKPLLLSLLLIGASISHAHLHLSPKPASTTFFTQSTLPPDATIIASDQATIRPAIEYVSQASAFMPEDETATVSYTEAGDREVTTSTIVFGAEYTNAVAINGYKIEVATGAAVVMCIYPVAGFYSMLPRILFYTVMVFAVLARNHPWLIIGSLASGLTYSATASIHGTVITVSGHGKSDANLFAIAGILVFSAAMVVPLLTWSETIRKLGAEREEDSIGRSVIVMWALIIGIGSISITYNVWANDAFPGGDNLLGREPGNVSCIPSSGVLDLSAGQNPNWPILLMTSDFIDSNDCINPCPSLVSPHADYKDLSWSLTRNPDDLTPVSAKEFNVFYYYDSRLRTVEEDEGYAAANLFFAFGTIGTVWIIVSLTLAKLSFGRRSIRHIRNDIYSNLMQLLTDVRKTDIKIDTSKHSHAHRLARLAGLSYYCWAVLNSVFSFILLVFSVVVTEFVLHEVPGMGKSYEVDSWAPWLSAALIIWAAFASKFWFPLEEDVARLFNRCTKKLDDLLHPRDSKSKRQHNQAETSEQASRRPSPIGSALADSWEKIKKKPNMWRENTNNFLKDLDEYWTDPWEQWRNNPSHFHRSRRLALDMDKPKIPEGWRQPGGDSYNEQDNDWQRIETFVERCCMVNMDNRNKGGEELLWQPRVIRHYENQYRESINWSQFWSIFRWERKVRDDEKLVKEHPTSQETSPERIHSTNSYLDQTLHEPR